MIHAAVRPWAPFIVAVFLASPFLLGHGGDPSYSCRGPAIAEVVRPAEEGSPSLRANFFDAGWQCNQDARHLVLVGLVILLAGLATSLVWRRRIAR